MKGRSLIFVGTGHLDRLIIVIAGGVPLVAFLAPLALAPLLLIAAVAALLLGPRRDILRAIPRGPAVLAAALLGWGLVSATWAIEPRVSLHKFAQLVPLVAAGLVLLGACRGGISSDGRTTASSVLAWAVVATLALFVIEAAFGAPMLRLRSLDATLGHEWMMSRHNRAATVVAILLSPAIVMIGGRYGWKAGAATAAAGIIVLSIMHSRTAMVAGLAAAVVTIVAWRWRALMQAMVAIALAAAIFLAPLLPALIPADPAQTAVMREEAIRHNVFSFFHRLRIWEFVVARIEEKPVLGWGLDASRSLPGGKEPSDASGERLSLHPHNAALQLRVELGIPALVLAAALVLWPVLYLRRYCGPGGPVILAMTTSALIVASMSYGIWQSWWMAALWLCVALASLWCPPVSEAN